MIPGNANPLLLASAAADAAAAGPIKSLRFNSADSAYLNRTPSSAGNRKTWTWSSWVKRSSFSGDQQLFYAAPSSSDTSHIRFTGETLHVFEFTSGFVWQLHTTRVFRDPSAWYHIVVAVDTTQSTASDRVKIYINGAEETDFSTSTYPSQNADTEFNNTVAHTIGRNNQGANNYLNAYLADVIWVDGSQLSPTSFGAYDSNNVWQATAYSGTFGTNGFHLLDFENESTIGHDSSGNENDFTAVNFSTTAGAGNDVLFDVPTNGTQSDTGAGGEVSGNYCTLNSLDKLLQTLSNGNLATTGSDLQAAVTGTIGVSSGKYYWEATAGSNKDVIGIWSAESRVTGYPGRTADSYGYFATGDTLNNETAASYGAAYASGDVIGVALDLDAGTLVFYKNGASQGTAFTGLSGTFRPAIRAGRTSVSSTVNANFGQRAWVYSAPSSHKALCTTNLPTPTIADGSDYFEAKTYTGNGSSQSITTSFSPDLVWVKTRSVVRNHVLCDIIRGTDTVLSTNLTDDESGFGGTGYITAFNSDGFSVGAQNSVNQSSATLVAWAWDAGSSTVSNTDGSITSSVRANQTAGFSIVGWDYDGTTGQYTVGHGLNTAPSAIIVRPREITSNWGFYHSALGNTTGVNFNQNAATNTNTGYWNNTSPTNSVFTLSTFFDDDSTYIAYCFAPVAGFSAFSSFEANGSVDGPFVYLGFRPALIIYRNISDGEHWLMIDSSRNSANPVSSHIHPNLSNAEAEGSPPWADFLSNGFKLRNLYNETNGSGDTILYMAWAENPFQANGGLAR